MRELTRWNVAYQWTFQTRAPIIGGCYTRWIAVFPASSLTGTLHVILLDILTAGPLQTRQGLVSCMFMIIMRGIISRLSCLLFTSAATQHFHCLRFPLTQYIWIRGLRRAWQGLRETCRPKHPVAPILVTCFASGIKMKCKQLQCWTAVCLK